MRRRCIEYVVLEDAHLQLSVLHPDGTFECEECKLLDELSLLCRRLFALEAIYVEAPWRVTMYGRIDGGILLDTLNESIIVCSRAPELVYGYSKNGTTDEGFGGLLGLQPDDAEW